MPLKRTIVPLYYYVAYYSGRYTGIPSVLPRVWTFFQRQVCPVTAGNVRRTNGEKENSRKFRRVTKLSCDDDTTPTRHASACIFLSVVHRGWITPGALVSFLFLELEVPPTCDSVTRESLASSELVRRLSRVCWMQKLRRIACKQDAHTHDTEPSRNEHYARLFVSTNFPILLFYISKPGPPDEFIGRVQRRFLSLSISSDILSFFGIYTVVLILFLNRNLFCVILLYCNKQFVTTYYIVHYIIILWQYYNKRFTLDIFYIFLCIALVFP